MKIPSATRARALLDRLQIAVADSVGADSPALQ